MEKSVLPQRDIPYHLLDNAALDVDDQTKERINKILEDRQLEADYITNQLDMAKLNKNPSKGYLAKLERFKQRMGVLMKIEDLTVHSYADYDLGEFDCKFLGFFFQLSIYRYFLWKNYLIFAFLWKNRKDKYGKETN